MVVSGDGRVIYLSERVLELIGFVWFRVLFRCFRYVVKVE